MKSKDLAKLLYSYFNQITTSYLEGLVPSNAKFPYLTYTYSFTEFETNIIQIKIYDKSQSVNGVLDIADKISESIKYGKVLKTEGGESVWFKKGNPFAQIVNDEDPSVRSVYVNLEINYL